MLSKNTEAMLKHRQLALLILRNTRNIQQNQCRSFGNRRPRIVSTQARTSTIKTNSSFVQPKTPETTPPSFPPTPPGDPVVVDTEMMMKNFALAAALCSFVGGVFYYSMSAVGQASGDDGDDPLSRLKIEAQEALAREEKEEEKKVGMNEDALKLMEEMQSPDFGPEFDAELLSDEDLDREEAENRKKRSLLNRIVFFWR